MYLYVLLNFGFALTIDVSYRENWWLLRLTSILYYWFTVYIILIGIINMQRRWINVYIMGILVLAIYKSGVINLGVIYRHIYRD